MRQIADYILVESLGEGNHGRFFKATPPERLHVDAESVAVKVLDATASDDDFRRFANELRIFNAVKSPYLVPVIDAGQQEGSLYYATPYFPEGSLARPTAPLDLAETIQVVADAARGAHALHEVGVAHRDIKPANIMLKRAAAGHRGSLSDLGLAQVLNPGQTVTGTGPIGSIEFMEPSIVRGEAASRSSDIWALGVTLHKSLTGDSVFGAIPTTDIVASLRHVLSTPATVSPRLPDLCAPVVRRCLEPDPANRPATAEDLANELEGLIA